MSNLKRMLEFKIEAIRTLNTNPRYMAIEKFVLEHGVLKQGRKLPRGYKLGKIKECFKNAVQLVQDRDDLTYVEGFAWRDGLPIEFRHGWAIDPLGEVVDVTWRNCSAKEEYLGIPIPRDILNRNMLQHGYYSVFWTGPLEIPNFKIIEELKKDRILVETG